MRKIYVARNAENTFNVTPCPIIFVPGVMGTRLQLPNGSYKWDPDSASDMIKLSWAEPASKRLVFDSKTDAVVLTDDIYIQEGEGFKINPITNIKQWFTVEQRKTDRETSAKQGFNSLVGDFYRDFLLNAHDKFKKYGMPVYAVGYDWRQSNKKSGQDTLVPAINRILADEQAEKCIIVTHSMGGLVTRAAIKISKELEAKTLGVVHVVQPVFGATVLYRRFFTGTIRRYDSNSLKPKAIIADKVLFDILGSSPHEFGENMSSLQGPLELLPTGSYDNAAVVRYIDKWLQWEVNSWGTFDDSEPSVFSSRYKGADSNIYGEYASEPKSESHAGGLYNFYGHDPEIKNNLLEKLTVASAFQQLLGANESGGKQAFKHPNTYAIAGTGLKTDVATEFDLKFESVREAVTHTQLRFAREERYNPALQRISYYSRVPMAERNKFVDDILLLIGDADFARLVKPIKPLEGDGTVPIRSAWGLFPDEADEEKITAPTFNPRTHRQLTVSGVEHGAAYNNASVTEAVHRLLKHINLSAIKDILEQERLEEENEQQKKEEERKKNWGKGGWRKDM